MKVAFLSHSGASIYHFRMPIIKALLKRGDEVFVVVPDDEYILKLQNLNLDFKIITYKLDRASLNPFIVLKNFLHLRKTLQKLDIDLLQSAAHKSNTLGIIAAKSAGVKKCIALVEGLGSFYIDTNLKARLIRFGIEFLYKITFRLADKFVFVNKSNALFMKNLGLKKEKIISIQSVGINLKRFFPQKIPKEQKEIFLQTYGLKTDLPLVLMVARALWHKGVKEFYAAAKSLEKEANFVLVGARDENISCANLEFLNGSNVCYLGASDDISFLLNLCDIFVLPSYKEGFPVSVLEAKACAKACVVSDCEGCVEAVKNGFDGLWAKTGDSKDLSDKIKLLLDDELLRKNLGQNAFKEALNYDENIIAKQYLKLYDELCEKNLS